MSDRDLIELSKREIEQIGLAAGVDVEDWLRVQGPEGVPDLRARNTETRLRPCGITSPASRTCRRSAVTGLGTHYDNQDHAMLTGKPRRAQCRSWVSGTTCGQPAPIRSALEEVGDEELIPKALEAAVDDAR